MLPSKVESFDEFEIVLRRAYEILHLRAELAAGHVQPANTSPEHANQAHVATVPVKPLNRALKTRKGEVF
jgi:hypothetical protein